MIHNIYLVDSSATNEGEMREWGCPVRILEGNSEILIMRCSIVGRVRDRGRQE